MHYIHYVCVNSSPKYKTEPTLDTATLQHNMYKQRKTLNICCPNFVECNFKYGRNKSKLVQDQKIPKKMRKTHKNHINSLREIFYIYFCWLNINAHALKKAILRENILYIIDTDYCGMPPAS